jgi:predicted nucleic acid-binding protein
MAYLLDTNILLRWVQPTDPVHGVATASVKELLRRGESLFVTPQNYIEFWGVATRPAAVNGLGMSPAQAAVEVQQLEALFPLLPDTPAVYPAWRQIVLSAGVSGAQVHDARLVAVMRAHGITHVMTLNPADFQRFAGIAVVRPQDVTPPPAVP